MKNIFKILMLCIFFASCQDSLDRNNATNKLLDAEIANRMTQLFVGKENEFFNPEQVDREVKAMLGKISVYNASNDVMKQADEYFNKLTREHLVKKEALIQISSLTSKPEIIVALKKNELAVLDQLLADRKK